MPGIGVEKAAAIAYRNLTTYLHSGSDYGDAVNGSIVAAFDLFGFCSPEFRAVIAAWEAVGLPPEDGDFGYNLFLCDSDLPPGLYRSMHSLIAAHEDCSMPVNADSVGYLFEAAHRVILKPGFSVTAGNEGFFVARLVDPCEGFSNALAGGGEPAKAAIAKQSPPEPSQVTSRAEASQAELNIELYPNPAQERISLSVSTSGTVMVAFFNAAGQRVYQQAFRGGTLEVPVHNWKPGLYFCRLMSDGEVVTRKLVVE